MPLILHVTPRDFRLVSLVPEMLSVVFDVADVVFVVPSLDVQGALLVAEQNRSVQVTELAQLLELMARQELEMAGMQ
jgi:hypothetical protein